MITIALFHEIFVEAIKVAVVIFFFVKWQTIKEIFCEKGASMSSKRVIAIMGMATLCRLAMYTTKEDGKIDSNVLLSLTVIILTAAAIATFPQIMEVAKNIKGFGSSLSTKETTETKKENTKTTTTTEASPEVVTPAEK